MVNINNSNDFETLKNKYFSDWIKNSDIYIVNDTNRGNILPDNNKPIKFDLSDNKIRPLDCKSSHIINNACKTNTCDFKIIIPHEYAIDSNQNAAYEQYILDVIQRYNINGIYVNDNKKDLKVSKGVPLALLGNLYNDILKYNLITEQNKITLDVIQSLKQYYINNNSISTDPYEQLYINLYNILFSNVSKDDNGPKDDTGSKDDTKLKNMFKINTLFTQTVFAIISTCFLYLYCKPNTDALDILRIYGTSEKYPLKYEYYTNGTGMEIIKKVSGPIDTMRHAMGDQKLEQLTTYIYVNLTKDKPDYYVRMIIDDKHKFLYRNNGLTYKEEVEVAEAIKNKKILFI
jgi:hypothetical protein